MKIDSSILVIVVSFIAGVIVGCDTESRARSIDDLVKMVTDRAEAGDTQFFESLLDKPYKGKSPQLIEMIKRSGMLTNFKQRLTKQPDGTGRLNYHYLEKGCYFQIDLLEHDGVWRITRIWFCR